MSSRLAPLYRLAASILTKKPILVMAAGFAATGMNQSLASAQSAAPACVAELASLMARWNAIGFAEPSKPAQAIVAGQRGYAINAGEYRYLIQEIRIAASDCGNGRDSDARRRIQNVQSDLDVIRHP